MLGNFWISLELSSSNLGIITASTLPVKKLTAFNNDGFAKSDNRAQNFHRAFLIPTTKGRGGWMISEVTEDRELKVKVQIKEK